MSEQKKCPDCGVAPGAAHASGCDVERCPECGEQRLSCDHNREPMTDPIPWTGEWPGDAECREFGLYCHSDTLRPCAADAPGATEDLNRLLTSARWDRTARRFVLRSAA